MISIEDALKEGTQMLKEGTNRPLLEAELLLCYLTGFSRVQLVTKADEIIDKKSYFNLVEKRAQNYPLEYLINEVSFYDTHLYIEEGVLIARPETEILVAKAIEYIQKNNIKSVAEIGIGSGAISVCVGKACSYVKIAASDINPKALNVAQKNIDKHGLNEQIKLYNCSLLNAINDEVELIISNPPYIANDFKLPKNVEYEPHNALFGGVRGDELLKEIVVVAKQKRVKALMCEMGYDQKEPMKEFFDTLGIPEYEFYKDLSGHDRGFIIYFK